MFSILSNSFRVATRTERQTDGQKPVCHVEQKRDCDRQRDAELALRRWHHRWFAG